MSYLSDRVVSHIDRILARLRSMIESWKNYRRKVQISGDAAPGPAQEQVASEHMDADASMQEEIAAIGEITKDVKKETRS